MTSVFDVIH